MPGLRRLIVLAAALGCLVPCALGALTKPERKEAKAMLSGTLYLRVDAPWETGAMLPMGISIKEPLVEVSPSEVRPEKEGGRMVFWEVGVNDAVRLDDFEVEDESVIHIDLVAANDGNKHGILHLVGVNTLAEFKAAFDRAFSRVPLQDEFPDWSADVRQAIAERRLMDGMTKRQAYCVVGPPTSFDEVEEGGRKVEVWRLKMNRGLRYSFLLTASNPPGTLRFEDGRLVGVGGTRSGNQVDLD